MMQRKQLFVQNLQFYQYICIQQASENQQPQKPKQVTFCFERNITYPISKCSSEYFTKKQKKHLSRKISRSIRGKSYEDMTSSEDEYKVEQDCDDSGSYYSIVEWKKLQESSIENGDGNNQNSQETNKIARNIIQLKPSLKKESQKRIKEYISQEQEETENSNQKLYGLKQHIIVTEFDKIMNDDDDEISITLDDLEEFNFQFQSRVPQKSDISNFDQIKKKMDLEPKFDLIEFYDNI